MASVFDGVLFIYARLIDSNELVLLCNELSLSNYVESLPLVWCEIFSLCNCKQQLVIPSAQFHTYGGLAFSFIKSQEND